MSGTVRSTRVFRGLVATGALLALAAVLVWFLTGREAFTRWPDTRLSSVDAPAAPGEDDLLHAVGFSSIGEPSTPTIESRFSLGLLPGGLDPKHLVSVATGLLTGSVLTVAGALGARRRAPALVISAKETPA